MICVKYEKMVIGSIYHPSNTIQLWVLVGFFVDIWLPKPTTVIFITGVIIVTLIHVSIFILDIDLFQLCVVRKKPCNTV